MGIFYLWNRAYIYIYIYIHMVSRCVNDFLESLATFALIIILHDLSIGLFYLLVSSQGLTYFWTSSFGSSINEPHIYIDWTRKDEFVWFRLTWCVVIALYAHIYIYTHTSKSLFFFFGSAGTLPTKQDVKMCHTFFSGEWLICLCINFQYKYRYRYK